VPRRGGVACSAQDFLAVLFLAVLFFAVLFLAGAFLAVDFAALVFFAGAFLAVDLAALDFLAGAFFAVDLAAPDFFAADFFIEEEALDDFFAADLVADEDAPVVFLPADLTVDVAADAAPRTLGGLGMLAAVRRGSFLAPEMMFFRSCPGVNLGTDFFLDFMRSPVCGLFTHRALRTTFSKEPKPVMATFSPLATSRVIVSSTDSSACAACLRLPS